MMNFNRPPIFAAALGLLAAQLPNVASADVTWTFNSTNCQSTVGPTGQCGGGGSNLADGRTYQGDDNASNVTVSGWANTLGDSTTRLELGKITHYGGGLGVTNADAAGGGDTNEGIDPEHAVDNNERFDLVLMDFSDGNPVTLTSISMGYISGDADISLLAYGGGVPTLAGVVYNEITEGLTGSGGWTLVGNYDLSGNSAVNLDPDGAGPMTSVSSQYWIVAAHNNVFGNDCIYDSNGCPNANEHFKIQSVAGAISRTPASSVPAPPTFMLMALGLAWLGRKQLKSA